MNLKGLNSGLVTNAHAQLRLLAYVSSQVRRIKTLVVEMNEEDLLRGIDIKELGLQEHVIANLYVIANLHHKDISTVWDLIWFGKERILDHPQLGSTGLKQITEQLALLGLTMSD